MKVRLVLFILLFIPLASIASKENILTVATTTSTENSGLLNYLLPLFEKQHNINVRVIATGTGKAIKLAERGDVDMIIVHAPDQEKKFVSSGFGVNPKSLMYNHFLIVGPKNDPANIKNLKTATQVFSNIYNAQSIFVSRGDDSGTHFKELKIWQESKKNPSGAWYKEVGQGMGKTLQIANELEAYTLVDQGTWLKFQDKLQLELLYYGDPIMFNPYSVILVNPERYPGTSHKSAQVFSNWLTSKETKKVINKYKVKEKQLFFAE